MPSAAIIGNDDVFVLTEPGRSQLKDARSSLSSQALEVLVLVDGRSNARELMHGMPVMSPGEVRDHLGALLAAGLIRRAEGSDKSLPLLDPGDFFKTIGTPVRFEADAGGEAKATAGLSSLREHGYYVSIARPAALPPGRKEGRRLALVVDDDQGVCNLLSTCLRLENFDVVVATNKAEVLEALRRPTPPDLALLDVNLPDVDGFHILSRMRQHPVLKSVPTIMLTASATRADVLKGLHFGADGYVTKPFTFETLSRAVNTVLGIGTTGRE